jgi:hypothetical protein
MEMHLQKLEMHLQNPWKSMEMHLKSQDWKCIFPRGKVNFEKFILMRINNVRIKVEWGFADNLYFIISFFKIFFAGDYDSAVKNYPIFENVEKAP